MARPDAAGLPDPSSRASLAVAAIVCAIVTLTLAWPALGGAFLVNPNSDQYIAGFPFREFAAASLREGRGFPQWNPYLFGGMPYVAAMHGDIFYPTFLLRMVLPTDVAMTWGFVLHMVLAGWFTAGFLRATGVGAPATLVGAVTYLLSGPIASYASPGHDGKLFVSTLLPAALWALVRGVRDGRRAAWGALALVVGLAVLSPHPQLLQYLLLTAGAYALFLALRPVHVGSDLAAAASDTTPTARYARLGYALGAVLLGGAIGAIQYLPVREYVAWSPRSGGKGYDYATSFSFPLEETINVYLPQFSGILDRYWGRNGIHFHSEYLGAAVLVLALLAFGGGLANRHRRHAWFWLGAFVVALFWAWGGGTPFYQLVYAVVPGTKFFRAPSTILYVVAFATATLAAFGAERLLAGRMSTRYAAGWTAFALLVGLVASTGGLTGLAMSLLGVERGEAILANAPAVVAGAWRSAAFVVGACLLGVAVARDRVPRGIAAWLLLALLTTDLWSVARHYWSFSPRAATLYAEDAIVRFLRTQPQPARVVALPLSDNMAPHDPFIAGDALMYHDVRAVLGYHGNELGRYQELYGKNDGYQPIANPNFWSVTNARFFYTNVPEVPFPGATLVAGPVRNAAGTMTYLYELPGDHPPAWVVPLRVKLDDATARATLLDPRFDVKRVALFDTATAVPTSAVDTPVPPSLDLDVTVTRYEPGAIELSLARPAPAGSTLVVSENFYPGWRAEVDGRRVTIGRADLTLIGVPLGEGARSVRLRFESASYRSGRSITLAALAAALGWLALGYLRDRRNLDMARAS